MARRNRLDTHLGPGRARARLVLAAAVAALLLATTSLTGCGSYRQPKLNGVRSFALALGVDPLDTGALDRLGRYDLVVVDGGTTTAAQVQGLQDRGAIVLGYLSIGTVEPYRPWFATARDRGWLLDRWEDWDEYYADVSAPGLRTLLLGEARAELAKGFDGLFLDNVDMVEDHPAQAVGMRQLVADLDRAVGSGRSLFAQNGDASIDAVADHLDGWNREDVSWTYDFATETYRATSAADRRAALDTLRRLRAKGLLVTATDYTAQATGTAVSEARTAACGVGALPFASDIALRRLPASPPTCP